MPIQAPSLPVAGVRLVVTRPFRAIPEPELFIQGAVTGLTEELLRAGYDLLGTTYDPEDDPQLLRELEGLNERRPGTGALALDFVEAPTLVGFGTAYAHIGCRVLGPRGEILLQQDLPLPIRRPLRDLLLPRSRPEVDGRRWAARVWSQILQPLFPPRGGPA